MKAAVRSCVCVVLHIKQVNKLSRSVIVMCYAIFLKLEFVLTPLTQMLTPRIFLQKASSRSLTPVRPPAEVAGRHGGLDEDANVV